jgi:hypothetical protein
MKRKKRKNKMKFLVKWYCMPDTWELVCPIFLKVSLPLCFISFCFFFSFFSSSVFFFLDVVNPNFVRSMFVYVSMSDNVYAN